MKQVLIPCAGMGTRVRDHFKTIKPLIKVRNKTLISYVIENVWCEEANYIFVVQREHCKDFGLDEHLQKEVKRLGNTCQIIQLDGQTSGAAVTCLQARHLIDNSENLIIINSDQYVASFSTKNLFKQMEIDRADAGIIVFNDNSPKWSFIKLNQFGQVCRVVEKQPISDLPTIGIYAWNKGSDFVRMADQMISDDFRVGGELYVSPCCDYACKNGLIVKAYFMEKCFGTGTVQDIEAFERYINAI